jgi:hypothetical protein
MKPPLLCYETMYHIISPFIHKASTVIPTIGFIGAVNYAYTRLIITCWEK